MKQEWRVFDLGLWFLALLSRNSPSVVPRYPGEEREEDTKRSKMDKELEEAALRAESTSSTRNLSSRRVRPTQETR